MSGQMRKSDLQSSKSPVVALYIDRTCTSMLEDLESSCTAFYVPCITVMFYIYLMIKF
jgi:hypothetical protein